ncbi:MAG: helix-turn-helix domain-containing protein [Pseudomonadota bacterium]
MFDSPPQSSEKPIRSIARAIHVMQAINRFGALNMTQISNLVGLPYPTTCRVVNTLLTEGVIERETSRKFYRPTALAQSLSCGYHARSRLIAIARRHIEQLTQVTSWPISLSSRVGRNMVIQDSTHALTTMTFSEYPPGYTMPLLSSASGLVYLASLPLAQRNDLLGQIEFDPVSNPEARLIQNDPDRYFQNIRDLGYATFIKNPHTKDPGKTSSIAVSLHRKDELVGCMTLIFFSSAMRVADAYDRFGAQLRQAQDAINADLASMKLFNPEELDLGIEA